MFPIKASIHSGKNGGNSATAPSPVSPYRRRYHSVASLNQEGLKPSTLWSRIGRTIQNYADEPEVKNVFLSREGRELKLPEKTLPDPELLSWHREKIAQLNGSSVDEPIAMKYLGEAVEDLAHVIRHHQELFR